MDDYVIVGAGSAGCALAARLSEDPDVKVALVEAGPPDTAPEIHLPVAFAQLFQTKWDWDYLTDPEPGLDGRRRYLPRGKMVGGSSSMNAMIYMRGNPADYAEWEALGAAGWGWDGMLPYFLRAEDNQRGASQLHAVGGPLTVSDGRSRHVLVDAFLEAAERAGHPRTDDFNGPAQDGVGYYQLTQRNGMRCSAAVAYLHPAMGRANLTGLTDAHCTRVLFVGDRAVGVEVERGDQLLELRAEREVILCAGAYNSPQLLMLSGIGIAAELRAYGIQPRTDLPVAKPPRPPACQPCLPDRRRDADQRPDRGESGAFADPGPWAADLQHRRGGRVCPDGCRPGRAGLPAARRPGDVRRRGPGPAGPARLHLRRRPAAPEQSRQGVPALAAADGQAAHRPRLLDDRAGPGRHDPGDAGAAADRRAAAACPGAARGAARAGLRRRR